jgi:hypothetical protein
VENKNILKHQQPDRADLHRSAHHIFRATDLEDSHFMQQNIKFYFYFIYKFHEIYIVVIGNMKWSIL